jgi:Uncharacterised nucleotidyltransferase
MAGPTDLIVALIRRPEQARSLDAVAWDLTIRQARAAGLLARLHGILVARDLLQAVPEAPRRHLEEADVVAQKHARDVRWEVACIRRALAGVVDRLILLKGAAYLLADLPPARGRIFNDIDILAPRERLQEVENALQIGGWVYGKLTAYDNSYYRRWMHQIPPMTHIARQTAVDVHHTLAPLTARPRLDPQSLRDSTRPTPGDADIHVLAPEDMVLHSAVHLFDEGEFGRGLRDLCDLDLLLRHFAADPGFWERLSSRAEALDLARPLFYLLRHAARLLATPAPAEILAAPRARPAAPVLAIMDALFAQALRPPHASCRDGMTGAALFLLYVRAHFLRMPLHLLLPHLLRKAYSRRFPDE